MTVLHAGYFWLALGLGLLGVSMLADWVMEPLALHVLTLGAMGTMTLAVMTRAVLGHTGRDLHAGPWVVAIYGFRNAGGLHARSLRGRADSKSALGNRRQFGLSPSRCLPPISRR